MVYHNTTEGTAGRHKAPREEKVKDTVPKKQKRGGDHLELVSMEPGKNPVPSTFLQQPLLPPPPVCSSLWL